MLGFRIPLAGFRIPKPWIPDSTDQNYLDSGFRITLHGAREEFLSSTYVLVGKSIDDIDHEYFVREAGRSLYSF